MGSPLRSFTVREDKSLKDLATYGGTFERTAAIDTYTWMYQFLHKIRDYETGKPLTDDEGRVTSHLSGLYYRTMNLLEAGVKPVFVFEGGYPDLKEEEVKSRRQSKEKAQREYEVARKIGDHDRAAKLETERRGISEEMQETAFDLIEAMGCPMIVPPEEAEAQCARMCEDNQVDYVISSDYDTLLYGSPNLVQELDSSGGELVLLDKSLQENNISLKELMWIGLMLGTDYNSSPHGIGAKTAKKIAKSSDSIGEVIEKCREYDEVDEDRWRSTYDLFAYPNVDLDIEWGEWTLPNKDIILELLVEKHGFSENRVTSAMEEVEMVVGQSGFQDF